MQNKTRVNFLALIGLVIGVSWVNVAYASHSDSIQTKIESAGASWTARENWITRLSKPQIQKILGLRNPPSVDAEFSAREPRTSMAEANEDFDWRSRDGINWVSPMLNQGSCGSCVAFAAVGTLETQVNITSRIPSLNFLYSTEALFSCGGGECDYGWLPDFAVRYLSSTGVPDEACAPYTMGATGTTASCSSICHDSVQRSMKIVSSSRPTIGLKNIAAVKAALKNGPLMTTMMVYDDFLYYSKGIYKHVTGSRAGGHAVSIVGFENSTRSWIIRNSWGSDWGENGFGHVSWDDTSGIGQSTWWMEVPTASGYLSIRNPIECSFVSGGIDVQIHSSFPQTSQIDYVISNGTGQVVQKGGCPVGQGSAGSCVAIVNTRTLPDGKYDIVSTADWGQSQKAVSQHAVFYVLNQAPTLALSFQGEGVNLSQPLNGRVVFAVQSSTGTSVPLSSIHFHVVSNGKEVFRKSADIVLPQMTLGWRTPAVPNGNYEVWLSGELRTNERHFSVESQRYTVTVSN